MNLEQFEEVEYKDFLVEKISVSKPVLFPSVILWFDTRTGPFMTAIKLI